MAKKKLKRDVQGPKAKKKAAASNTKRAARPAKSAVKAKPAASAGKAPKTVRTSSWLDDEGNKPIIERYARRLAPFVEALADGKVDESEVKAQETRLVRLMKQVEPELSAAQHAKVTQLLCELTAYDLMQVLHTMEQNRPKTQFRG